MKKFLVLALIIGMCALLIAGEKPAKKMIAGGAKPSTLVLHAIDSNSTLQSQIMHRPANTPISISATANDTSWFFVASCPAGMTGTVRAAKITCAEAQPDDNGNTNITWGLVKYDASATELQKMMTETSLDADSSYLVANVMTAVTLDSTSTLTLGTGDIIWARTMTDTANVVNQGIGVTLDIDYNE